VEQVMQLNFFFDPKNRLDELEKLGDPLVRLDRVVNWDSFRPLLKKIHQKPRKSNAGRKPWDSVRMFKMLILQTLYNLSDDQTEYQIRDRLSFQRFLGLAPEDPVPDAKTLWLFREQLTRHGLMKKLFDAFDKQLWQAGFLPKGGQIIDASLVNVPRNRNRRKENEDIKQGKIPEAWKQQPNKKRQKDMDARWSQKHGKNHYGYKNHINIDKQNKLIRQYTVTDAAVHDSQVFDELLDKKNKGRAIWANSASKEREAKLKADGYLSRIHYKGHRNRKLTEKEQAANHARSRTRARVEHVFGHQQMLSGGGFWVRTKGKVRASVKIGLMNLVYNMRRLEYLLKGSSAQMAG